MAGGLGRGAETRQPQPACCTCCSPQAEPSFPSSEGHHKGQCFVAHENQMKFKFQRHQQSPMGTSQACLSSRHLWIPSATSAGPRSRNQDCMTYKCLKCLFSGLLKKRVVNTCDIAYKNPPVGRDRGYYQKDDGHPLEAEVQVQGEDHSPTTWKMS